MTTTAITLFALTLAVIVLILRTSIHNRAIRDLQDRLTKTKRHANLMVDKANDHLAATQELANMLGYCIHIEEIKLTFMDIVKGDEVRKKLVVHKLEEALEINPTKTHTFELQDPTEEDLQSPVFEAIWQAIKLWDIERDFEAGRAGATGTDVKTILNAIAPFIVSKKKKRKVAVKRVQK